MSWDFTLDKYRELCDAIVSSGYQVMTVKQYLEGGNTDRPLVILRHDVDHWPGNALRMAKAEQTLELHTTYYFRKTRGSFKPEIIRQITSLGHEVGYHYEALSRAGGDYQRAIEIFRSELEDFRRICEVKTIAMHGSPLSKWDNRELWKECDFGRFGVLGEVYLSIDYDKVTYLSDTGRTWDSKAFNIRDTVTVDNAPRLSTTDDLISLIRSREINQLCIQAHPARWAASRLQWFEKALRDHCANLVKSGLRICRGSFDAS